MLFPAALAQVGVEEAVVVLPALLAGPVNPVLAGVGNIEIFAYFCPVDLLLLLNQI